MAVKKKKKEIAEPPESEVQDEVLVTTTDLEPEVEEVQFTDTSYTSASFESLPPAPVEEIKPKDRRRKKKKAEEKVSVTKRTSSEMFNWSEESIGLATSEIEHPAIEKHVDESSKKGKKGKKKKKEQEEIPDFEKKSLPAEPRGEPKSWKKMHRKEREAWLVQRIEEWRIEKEAEKQAILAGAKEKRAQLAKERNELMAKDVDEQDVRRDLLKKTVVLFSKYERQKIDQLNKKQMKEEWQQYLRCDGLPDPRVVTQMNTYLHKWRLQDFCDDTELDKKCIEVLPMLELLEEQVQRTRQLTPTQINNYNEIRLELRAQLSEAIQQASYFLLRDLEKYLTFESTKVATYEREFKNLRLNIWVAIKWPTRKPKPVEPEREPVQLSFPAMKVTVKLPKIIDGSCVCVRAARSMVDLLSESSRSFGVPSEMANRYIDLFEFNEQELKDVIKWKQTYDEARTKFYKEIRERLREVEAFLKANPYTKNEKEKEELDNLNMAEPPFMPDPRTHIADLNEIAFKKYLRSCKIRTRGGELNLRKYRICGGVLNLDLLTTPPQPKRMRNAIAITTSALQLL